MINFLKGGICMAKRIEKTNYWNQKVKYLGMHSAQSFLKSPTYANNMNGKMISSDCSCNCHGGCSGGDCSSCSYGNS